ncbi:MAG: DmsE family decaheme c-type cytochrome [Deltaproteobacteria bacterium]|nr:DmsE family decaheme c-type cytochrome [Deltaproteobacteria bacterium]
MTGRPAWRWLLLFSLWLASGASRAANEPDVADAGWTESPAPPDAPWTADAGAAVAPPGPEGAGAAAAGEADAKSPAAQQAETCAECHEDLAGAFGKNIHAKTGHYGMPGRCESCHPGAALHAESGDRSKVVNPAKVDAAESSASCLACHGRDRGHTWWRGSSHARREVGCVSCHAVHEGGSRQLRGATEGAVCFRCHLDVRADLLKRSRHPLRDSALAWGEGKMTCSSCHNPHGGRARALIDAASINDKCYQCHFEKRAPVLWEHSPVKEDCLVCHTAHGSSNDKLLTTRIPRLCQECHMQGRHQSGSLATRSVFALNRSCLNCHPQVHGSNNPSGTVLQR